jgi:tRNA pseudouridine38-40 synthase
MQINPDVPSIELDLHKALAEAQCVSVDNQMNPVKCGFQRCARTDKGVHAAGQVVSLKLILDNDMIPRINSFLPKQIRVWDVCRVNNGFNSKNQCDSRNYEYLLPTYCLQPVDSALYPNSNVGKRHGLQGTILSGTIVDIPVPTREELDKKRMYRICESKLLLLKDLLQQFVGTRNHFNFTVGKEFKDASAKRFIMNWNVGTPFVRDGIEWVSCRVEGQSFMLHQIRKMMGLVIMMIRTETPIKLFDTCFTSQRINIPKAPALGLLLQHPNFHIYNRDFGGKDERNPIDFNQYKVSI